MLGVFGAVIMVSLRVSALVMSREELEDLCVTITAAVPEKLILFPVFSFSSFFTVVYFLHLCISRSAL